MRRDQKTHSSTFAPRRHAVAGALCCCVLVGGCAQGSGTSTPEVPDGAFVLASDAFVRDVSAIGADWYDYDGTTHAVTPKAQRYVVEDVGPDGSRYAAFRIRSYYDSETADSGRFSLSSTVFADGEWAPERQWVVGRNVRQDGAACVDVFEREDVDCTGAGWQVQFRVFPLLVPEAGIVVGNPGVFVRSVDGADGLDRVNVATFEGDDLSTLPNPETVAHLSTEATAPWNIVEWNRGQFAPNLPRQGMAIGTKVVDGQHSPAGDVLFLMTPSQAVVRLALSVDSDRDLLVVRHAMAEFDLELGLHLPFGAAHTTEHDLPADGEVHYQVFTADGVERLEAEPQLSVQLTPPFEKDWDIAVEKTAGEFRVVLSPSSAVLNATVDSGADIEAFDTAMPPLGANP